MIWLKFSKLLVTILHLFILPLALTYFNCSRNNFFQDYQTFCEFKKLKQSCNKSPPEDGFLYYVSIGSIQIWGVFFSRKTLKNKKIKTTKLTKIKKKKKWWSSPVIPVKQGFYLKIVEWCSYLIQTSEVRNK